MKNEQNTLVGRKVRGFKFEDTESIGYVPGMDDYIGKIGTITEQDNEGDCIVLFEGGDKFYYPASEIKNHLVEEEIDPFKILENIVGGGPKHPGDLIQMHWAVDGMIQFAAIKVKEAEESKWIPVSERLPEKDCSVLVYDLNNPFDDGQCVAKFNEYQKCFFVNGSDTIHPTHYQPLPAAPKTK